MTAREGLADLSIIQEDLLGCLHTNRSEDEQMRLQSPAAHGPHHVLAQSLEEVHEAEGRIINLDSLLRAQKLNAQHIFTRLARVGE